MRWWRVHGNPRSIRESHMLSCSPRVQRVMLITSAGRETVRNVAPPFSALPGPQGKRHKKESCSHDAANQTSLHCLPPLRMGKGNPPKRANPPHLPSLFMVTVRQANHGNQHGVALWLNAPSHRRAPAKPSPLHLIRWSLLHALLTARRAALTNASSAAYISLDHTGSSLLPLPIKHRGTSRPVGTSSSIV